MDPELQELLGDLKPFPEATADSIFQSIQPPERPFRVLSLTPGSAAQFDEKDRQVFFDMLSMIVVKDRAQQDAQLQGRKIGSMEALQESDFPGIIAHELMHQATIDEERNVGSDEPQIQGLLNAFGRRWEGATDEQRSNLYGSYYEEGEGPGVDRITEDSLGFAEIFAKTAEGGYNLARRANQGGIKELLSYQDETYPGTREMFNFFIRRFPR